MKALSYLLACKLKNSIISVFRTPAKLISFVVLVALLAFPYLTGQHSTLPSSAEYRDINELYAIVLLLYSVIFVLVSKNGFHNGASMFSMADVNMIFTAPVSQGRILSFGLFQQLGRSLLIGYVILFQYSLVNQTYGVGFPVLIYILIGYGITVFLSQMTAMVIYSYTSGNDSRRALVKTVYILVIAAFVAYVPALAHQIGGINISSLVYAARSVIPRLFPVSGIISFAVEGAIEGDLIKIGDGLLYCAVFRVFYRIAILLINSDYYEDVLQSTEASYSAIQARKEGKVAENTPRNIKTGRIGIEKGKGASVIAEKHRIENRRGRVFMLSTMSLVMVCASVLGCFIFRSMPIGVFVMNIYMLTMGIASGRWGKELSYPYIYLIPEKPHIKLWHTLRGEFIPLIAESVLCFAPVYFIMHLSIEEAAGMIIGRISFGLLFISVNLLLQRMFGSSDKKVLVLMIYFLLIVFFSAPGIFAGVFVTMFYPFWFTAAYAVMSTVNFLVAACLAFACRNVLSEVG